MMETMETMENTQLTLFPLESDDSDFQKSLITPHVFTRPRKPSFKLIQAQETLKDLSLEHRLSREETYEKLSELGYKWNGESWYFEHYIYWRLPEHIYTIRQLEEIERVPKKGARRWSCWNGQHFISVYDINETRQKRELTESQQKNLAYGREIRQGMWKIYDFLVENEEYEFPIVTWHNWLFFTNGRVFHVVKNSHGMFLRGRIERKSLIPTNNKYHEMILFRATTYLKPEVAAKVVCRLLCHHYGPAYEKARVLNYDELQ